MKKFLKIFLVLVLLFVAHFFLNIAILLYSDGKYCDNGKSCPFLSRCETRTWFNQLDIDNPTTRYVCEPVPWVKNPYVDALFGVDLGAGPEPPW